MLVVSTVPVTIKSFLLPYVERLRSDGWRVDAATGSADPKLVPWFDEIHEVPWTRSVRDSSSIIRSAQVVRKVVSENRYDVVHVHTPIASFVTRLACRTLPRRRRPRVVYTAHGFHFHPQEPAAANVGFIIAEKLAARWCDRIVVINEADLKAARRYRIGPPGRVIKFPGIGIDLEWYKPTTELVEAAARFRAGQGFDITDVVFSMVAEMTPRKNHAVVLRALADNRQLGHHVVFAGRGPLRDALEREAARLGIADQTHFVGQLGDVRPLILGSAASLLPSRREGLPRVVLEALALGVPVIGSRIHGTVDLVDEHAGVLVEPNDAAGFARAMRDLARPGFGPVLPQTVTARLQEYTIEHLLDLHEDLYHELLDADQPTARSLRAGSPGPGAIQYSGFDVKRSSQRGPL